MSTTSGISFSGLGSGLDTQSIISQLVSLKRSPITALKTRQTTLETQKGIVKSISSSLLTLKSSVGKLADSSTFSIVKAQSSDTSRVAVTATNDAAAGGLSVEVLSLAQARRLSSRSFSSLSGALGLTGEMVVNGKGLEVKATDSLVDLRDRINNSGLGISAQILSVATTDNRLILTADTVGAAGFDLKDASSSNLLQGLGFTSSVTTVKTAFTNGARSEGFLAADQAVGTLLGLSQSPTGTVTIGDREVALDLATDSLTAIRDKIAAAAPDGVSVAVAEYQESGLTRHRLEIRGTTNLVDDNGVLQNLGLVDGNGALVDGIVTGAQSDAYASTTTALGSLMRLGSAPAGSVSIGGQAIAIDLATDSLAAIQAKISAAAPAGVSTAITSTTDADGNRSFRLKIDGTADFVDSGNVLESLGVLTASNNAFESVAQTLTSNAALKQKGAVLNPLADGAASASLASDTDAVGALLGSTATGLVRIGDRTVSLDLNADSLTAIADKINAASPTGVSAAVTASGPGSFQLEINGTTDLVDDGGVLQALGVLGAPQALSAETRLGEIEGAGVKAGDTITISGTNHQGEMVTAAFAITGTNLKVQSLLNSIEQTFGGNVLASVDASGRIAVRDTQAGASQLAVQLTAQNEGGGALNLGTMAVTTRGVDARSSELQAGQDASLRINGITLTRSTNTVSDAVQGVTLDLAKAGEGEVVNVTITRDDTTAVKENIQAFVKDFNASMSLISQQFAVDEKTQKGGPLSGDSTVMAVQSQLRTALTGEISGLKEGFNALVLVGISFDREGVLNIDEDALDTALTSNLDEVRRLFVAEGSTTDNQISYVSSNTRTRAGTYAVSVTAAASRARLTGTQEFTGTLDQTQYLGVTDRATGQVARIELAAGLTLDQVVARINDEVGSDVAEVRRADLVNTTDGTTPVAETTAFADIFGAGVRSGDTIRISGVTHDGSNVSSVFTMGDPATTKVADLLARIRSTFDGNVSASMDSSGRLTVIDDQVGASRLAVTLVEQNEGGGTLNFGSLDVQTEGRMGFELTATNSDNHLELQHAGYGTRNGFTITEAPAALGLAAGDYQGTDVAGTLGGQSAQGFGRILTGSLESDNVAGLSTRVDVTPEELAAGGSERGQVNLVFGVARQLSDMLTSITDTFTGSLTKRVTAIDDTISEISGQITSLESRATKYKSMLVSKFSALEKTVSTLQSQGNYLTSQLSGSSSSTKG